MKLIKIFLNRTTMYRVVLYFLFALVFYSFVLSFLGLISYNPLQLTVSLIAIVPVAYLSNLAFSKFFKVHVNYESWLITALILFFVMSPAFNLNDAFLLLISSVVAISSKFIVSYKGMHIFNPVAISAFLVGTFLSGLAIWWVGSFYFLPLTFVFALLVYSKIRKLRMLIWFLVSAFVTLFFYSLFTNVNYLDLLEVTFASWPLLFFVGFMVSEPITTPPGKTNQILYVIIIASISSWPFNIGGIFSSPELALIFANFIFYFASQKNRLCLTVKEVKQLSNSCKEFVFESDKKFKFKAGQYMEWTLDHKKIDNRGNRRFFTISSSPLDETISLGVKFYEPASSFKNELKNLKVGDQLFAGQIDGEFLLPKSKSIPLCFIAGGIGITPFISHLRYLLDQSDKREIVLFYANKSSEDIPYLEFLKNASERLNLKVVHCLGEAGNSKNLNGLNIEISRIDEKIIKKYLLKDLKDYQFYISGPSSMVDSLKKSLKEIKISRKRIKTDYFPGF